MNPEATADPEAGTRRLSDPNPGGPTSHRPRSPAARVLVVDDSSFMRASLTHLLSSDKSIEVVGTAADGEEALSRVADLGPDVVLLDIDMPRMDGLTALTHIMKKHPTPVVILSGIGEKDARVAIKALERGAVDFIAKPSGVISYDIEAIKDEILSKVRIAASVDVQSVAFEAREAVVAKERRPEPGRRKALVVLGASTGGPMAIGMVLGGIPRGIPAGVIVVQHMSPVFIPAFAERLRWETALDVSVAGQGDVVEAGKVYVAPSDRETALERNGEMARITVGQDASGRTAAGPIDRVMKSAADALGDATVGVLLTGAGEDGAEGMREIRESGGWTIAEDRSTCVVYGMPKAAIDLGAVDEIVPLPRIADAIMRRV